MLTDHFDEPVAARYDDDEATMFAPDVVEPAVDLLAELAADGAALELGVGTGRLALPLSARGVRVHGVDLSTAMLARLQAKPGAERIVTTCGDFATTTVPGSFSLVYLVFNTVMNLVTQDEQVACFGNAAAHLRPGGCFLVEVGVPQLQSLPPGERYHPYDVSAEHVGFDEYEVATQAMVSHHWYPEQDGRLRGGSTPFRYVWPAELDLMARLAGLRVRGRWEGWRREPFTSASRQHVSVWERPE